MVKHWMHCLLFALSIFLMSACSREPSQQAQGYIEGRYTYMATSVSGVLTDILVTRGSQVKKGQTLFILEAQPESDVYNAAVENLKQSVAARDESAANLVYNKLTFERNAILVKKNALQQSQLDNARAIYDANVAHLAQLDATIASSTATLAQAKWSKDQKIITAPLDAIVFDTYYRLGEYTTANQAVLSLLAPGDIKAIFYISEMDLANVHLNDKVSVQCDGCKNPFTGHISFISPTSEYTPPVIYSADTNYKLVYRIEAEFAKQDAYNLHPGQPITVMYHIHD